MDSRVWTFWSRRVLAVLAVAAGLLLLLTTEASAHAELVETNPANGAHLDRSPGELVLRFSEPVNPVRDGFSVLDGNGRTIERPAGTAEGDRVRVPLPGSLGDDVYVVNWRVVSADSHPIHGAFVFSVGTARAAPLADAGAQAGSDSAVGVLFWLLRLFGYVSLAVLIGGSFFVVACWPSGRTDRRALRLITAAWIGSVAAAVVALLLQGPNVAGSALHTVFDPSLLVDTVGTGYGVLLLARIVLLAAGGYVVLRLVKSAETLSYGASLATRNGQDGPGSRASGRSAIGLVAARPLGRSSGPPSRSQRTPLAGDGPARPAARGTVGAGQHAPPSPAGVLTVPRLQLAVLAVLAVGLAATWSGAGHPAAAGRLAWAALALDATHLVAVAVWLGGLAVLAGLTLGRRSRAAEDEAASAVTRYSRAAGISVVVLGATGLLQAWREIAASGVGTEYFSLLVFKVGAFGLLIWLAALSRAAVRNRLAAPAATRRRQVQRDMLGRLRQSVRWEVAIAAVVLGLTAALVATPPGGHDHGPAAVAESVAAGPFLEALAVPGGDVQVWMDPARTGANQLAVNVRDGGGLNRDVSAVTAELRLPANNIGPLPVELTRTGPGQYVADRVLVPVAGAWLLSLRIRSSDFEESTVDAQIQVR